MGCCQSNLASPTHPVNINCKHFVDQIKEDHEENQGKNQNQKGKLNDGKNNKNKAQQQDEYEYSVHGLKQDDPQAVSEVSIFNEQRKLNSRQASSSYGKRKNNHVEIHPEAIHGQTNKRKPTQQLPNTQRQPQTVSRTKKFLQTCEQFPVSRIDLLHQYNHNLQGEDDHFLNQEFSSTTLLMLQNNQTSSNYIQRTKQTNKAIYNQTEREMFQLNQEIATMIILWDQKGTDGKKLRLGTMKNQDEDQIKQEGQGQGQQNNQIAGFKNQQVDKDLEEIWNEDLPEQNKAIDSPSKQPTKPNTSKSHIKNLKNQYILQPNHNNQPKEKAQPTTKKLKEKSPSQDPKNVPNQKQNKPTPTNNNNHNKQDLKLHLSKMKGRKSTDVPEPNQNYNKKETEPQYESSQNQSDDEYSHCLLSNPTRILNDSLIEEFNVEKEVFYFCDKNSYKKWIQNDRKAFEVKKNVIEEVLLGNKQQSKHPSNTPSPLTKTICTLLSIIRDYHQLTGINLIAYRTFSSTSIFMQPQQREFNYSGFKIFINGTKRIYPFSQSFDCTQIGLQLQKMVHKLFEAEKNPAELLYNLTGWIPEYIVVGEINSFEGIFERLNNNFVQGNTIITFTGINNEHWGLKSINLQRKQIYLYGCNIDLSVSKNLHDFTQKYTWDQFTTMIASINVNWNPLIYQYVWKTQNIFFSENELQLPKTLISELDPEYISDKSHQYLLKIPPSEEDIELRVFLEAHYDGEIIANSQVQPLVIELYDYMGGRINSLSVAIRNIDKKKAVYSDVLIFEGSKQRTEYILLIRPQESTFNSQLKYTISAFSFFEVGLSQLPIQRVVEQKQITTFLQDSHCGYGINSPYFLDNFYMQLKVPARQRVRIFVQMPCDECSFEINLVANPQGEENLTRLNLETILNEIITSEEFNHGKGYLQIETKHEEYFLMLTNHTKCKGEFKIVIQVLQKQPKALTKEKMTQIQTINANKDQFIRKMISNKEKFFYQEAVIKKQFKWTPLNTGPRKRLKSNTHSGYQSFATFKEFFKNPYIDFKLEKGKKYQFSVVSNTYREQFDQILPEEDKKDAEPPTLSLGIMKMAKPDAYDNHEKGTDGSTMFKIVLDDAFYVPFGFGFWTKAMEFEEGEYRFVFPKMEKEGGQGVFCVYEIQ